MSFLAPLLVLLVTDWISCTVRSSELFQLWGRNLAIISWDISSSKVNLEKRFFSYSSSFSLQGTASMYARHDLIPLLNTIEEHTCNLNHSVVSNVQRSYLQFKR